MGGLLYHLLQVTQGTLCRADCEQHFCRLLLDHRNIISYCLVIRLYVKGLYGEIVEICAIL